MFVAASEKYYSLTKDLCKNQPQNTLPGCVLFLENTFNLIWVFQPFGHLNFQLR